MDSGNYTDEEKTINESFNNSSNVKISYIQHKLNEETLESILNGENAERPDKCGENAFWSLDEGTGTLTISGSGETYDYGDWAYDGQTPPWCALKVMLQT